MIDVDATKDDVDVQQVEQAWIIQVANYAIAVFNNTGQRRPVSWRFRQKKEKDITRQ